MVAGEFEVEVASLLSLSGNRPSIVDGSSTQKTQRTSGDSPGRALTPGIPLGGFVKGAR